MLIFPTLFFPTAVNSFFCSFFEWLRKWVTFKDYPVETTPVSHHTAVSRLYPFYSTQLMYFVFCRLYLFSPQPPRQRLAPICHLSTLAGAGLPIHMIGEVSWELKRRRLWAVLVLDPLCFCTSANKDNPNLGGSVLECDP